MDPMNTTEPFLALSLAGYRIEIKDWGVFDTRCRRRWSATDLEHAHELEYLRALLFITDELGLTVEVDADPAMIVGARTEPLLRGRYRFMKSLLRFIGLEVAPLQLRKLDYRAEKLFGEDWCPVLAVEKRVGLPLLTAASLARVDELAAFVTVHRRFPREAATMPGEKALAVWLLSQRANEKPLVAAELDARVPGWRESGREGKWHRTFEAVAEFVRREGRAPSRYSTDPDERRLGGWLHNQRTAQRSVTGGRNWTLEKERLLSGILPDMFAHP